MSIEWGKTIVGHNSKWERKKCSLTAHGTWLKFFILKKLLVSCRACILWLLMHLFTPAMLPCHNSILSEEFLIRNPVRFASHTRLFVWIPKKVSETERKNQHELSVNSTKFCIVNEILMNFNVICRQCKFKSCPTH